MRCRAETSQLYSDLGSVRGPVVSIIKDVANSARVAAGAVAGTALEAVQQALGAVGALGTVGALVGGAAELISTGFSTAFGIVGSIVSGVVEAARGTVSGVVEAAVGTVRTAAGLVVTLLGTIAGALTGNFAAALNGVAAVVGGVLEVIHGLATIVTSVISGIVTGVLGVVSAAVKGLTSLFEQMVSLAAAGASRVIGFFAGLAAGVLAPALSAFTRSLTDFDYWIGAAARFEAQNARINAMLTGSGNAAGWSSKQLEQMARQLASLGSYSFGQIREAEQTLLRFQNIRGDQFYEALKASRQLAAALGVDLVQAARLLGRALEDPEHGFMALRRAGVTLDATQKDLLKAAIASGDFAAAQNVVLARVAKLGDVAGAVAGTLQGQVQQLTLTWNGIGAAMGRALEPLASVVVEFLQPLVEGFAQVFRGFLGTVETGTQGVLASARAWIAENRETIVGWGRGIADTVVSLVNGVRSAFSALADWMTDLFPSLQEDGLSLVQAIPGAVTTAVSAARTAADNMNLVWDLISSYATLTFQRIADTITQTFSYVVTTVKNFFLNLWDDVTIGYNRIAFNVLKSSEWYMPDSLKETQQQLFDAGERANQAAADAAKERRDLEAAAERARIMAGEDSQEVKAAQAALDANLAKFQETMRVAQALAGASPAQRDRPWWMGPAGPAEDGFGRPNNQAVEMDKFKFTFTGLEAMSKKIQESITGAGMEGLARQQIGATKDVKGGVDRSNSLIQAGNDLLKSLVDKLPAGWGFGA